jgi:hypothetical protein
MIYTRAAAKFAKPPGKSLSHAQSTDRRAADVITGKVASD